MRALLLLPILALVASSCSTHKPVTDGGQKTPCDRMCAHFRALMCAEGEDFYDCDVAGPVGVPNTTCEEFCEVQMELGVEINAECAAKAPTCEKIESYRAMTSCD